MQEIDLGGVRQIVDRVVATPSKPDNLRSCLGVDARDFALDEAERVWIQAGGVAELDPEPVG